MVMRSVKCRYPGCSELGERLEITDGALPPKEHTELHLDICERHKGLWGAKAGGMLRWVRQELTSQIDESKVEYLPRIA